MKSILQSCKMGLFGVIRVFTFRDQMRQEGSVDHLAWFGEDVFEI